MDICAANGNIPEHIHLSGEQEVALRNVRTYEQYALMRQGFETGECGFCRLDPIRNVPLVFSTITVWNVWHNAFPHDHTDHHVVAAPKRHVRFMHELDRTEWLEFTLLCTYIGMQYYAERGGGTIIREGALTYTAGTVPHLHVNLVVPDLTGPVSAVLAKDAKTIQDEHDRMVAFARRYNLEFRRT